MNLYVAGDKVGVSIEKNDVEDAFGKFGKLASVWVARQPPGFAFIEFEDRRDGEDAINEMNNKELFGCLLRVEESKGRRGKGGKGGDDGMKPGDWICRRCNAMNFARRQECFRCYAPGGGGGGGGYNDRGRGGGYDDRGRGGGYDDRRGGYDDRRGGYDDRRRSRSPPPRRRDSRDRSPPPRRDSRDRSPPRRSPEARRSERRSRSRD